ncbi:MAG: HAD-IA family hydrolase [Anaerolineae bacterium]
MSMLPGTIAAVLFDFDGTLVHQQIDFALMRQRVLEIARSCGAPEELLEGRYVLELIERVTPVLGHDGIRFARLAQEAITAIEVEAAEQAWPFDGTAELLADLNERGYRLAIITRNCRAAVDRVLARYPLSCDTLLTRDDVPAVKPDPRHLLAALHEQGVSPRQALMVGDHPMDILGGRRIGAATVGILPAGAAPGYYAEQQPDIILNHINELGQCLARCAAPVEAPRVELQRTERVYDGFFKLDQVTLRYERFDGSLTESHERLLFERGDAAAVLPYDPLTRRVVLVSQFRLPVYKRGESGWLWETIAGMVDSGRSPEQVAHTEAEEEGGYLLGALEHALTVYLSPGASTERVFIYLAPLLPGMRRTAGGGLQQEHEDILVRLFTLDEAVQMVRSGAIRDAKTVLALQYLALHHERLFSTGG